jgi:predicted alpha-1,6-mannanase (GH76 family)
MNNKNRNRSTNHARRLILAAGFSFAILFLATTASAQIAVQNGSPLTITHATGTAISRSFTATAGASVMVVALEDRGTNLPEPATMSWNGQTLTRDVQTAYSSTSGTPRSLAIYHLFNPTAGTANITGTLGAGVTDTWLASYTLSGVNTNIAPITGSTNTGSSSTGTTNLNINIGGIAGCSWAAVSSDFGNLATVTITGTGGTGTIVTDTNDATMSATAGYVAVLSSGSVTFSNIFVPSGGSPQKANFAVDVFTANSVPQTFGQIAIQDGSPLTYNYATGNSISQPFTATFGAGVMVVILEDKGANLTEPATLSWNGQTLTRDVQTAYTTGVQRSLAIYHLFNPTAGTSTITGTLGSGVSDQWVTAYTLSGVDTTTAPVTGSTNTGNGTGGVTNLFVGLNGIAGGSWAAVSSEFANFGSVNVFGTGGMGNTGSDYGDATTTATAGYVAGLNAGSITFTDSFASFTGVGPQKGNFAVVVFTPVSTPQSFGIKFLGDTTDYVTGSAGVVPILGWTNITDGTFTSGTILSSDGSASATLTRSGPGKTDTWDSGAYPDGGNGSLIDGYNDARVNGATTNVISGLTGAAYDIYLYTGGDTARPSSGTDWLPNYTVNGTAYYTATLKGYDAMLKGFVQGIPTSQNTNTYPSTLVAGHYLKISNVVPVGGAITISANSDTRTYRSPLNGIELVSVGILPEIMSQPSPHRFYTGGSVNFQVQAEGTGTLGYRWRQNGTNLNNGGTISGALTNSLTITNLTLANAGNYDVVITNSYGSVTSLVANLNVVVETTADAAYENWLVAYLVHNGNQTYLVNSLTDRNFAFMWQQAYMIWTIEDTYNRTQSPDQKQLINDLLNTFIWQNKSDLTWDGWDDDMEWGIIALIKGYQITGNGAALNSAIFNWSAVNSRGLDNAFGGGIWEKLPKGYSSSKVVLCNCPQVVGGLALYQVTGQASYLTTSEAIYAWTWTNTFIATAAQATNGMVLGQVNEGVGYANTNNTGIALKQSNNSYNSGLFAMAASELYQVTGTTQYLSDALLAANQKVNSQPILNEDHVANGDFGGEMMVRGVALIAGQDQNNLWPAYGPWLQANATAAWNERRTDYNITHNNWTTATPAGTNDLDSMESEAAVLVQQMPTNIPGFVSATNKLSGTIIGTSGSWNNSGNTIAKVFDGNLTTFFDGPDATGDWVGLDFGAGVSNVISQINYWPRVGQAGRMLGGVFQGDNATNFPAPVTLYTITVVPPDNGTVTAIPITNPTAFRCVRYVGPTNGFCDVAELQFFAPNPGSPPVGHFLISLPPVDPPITLTNSWNGSQLTLSWSSGGLLLEATNFYGPWTTNATATPPFIITPSQPQEFFRVIAP